MTKQKSSEWPPLLKTEIIKTDKVDVMSSGLHNIKTQKKSFGAAARALEEAQKKDFLKIEITPTKTTERQKNPTEKLAEITETWNQKTEKLKADVEESLIEISNNLYLTDSEKAEKRAEVEQVRSNLQAKIDKEYTISRKPISNEALKRRAESEKIFGTYKPKQSPAEKGLSKEAMEKMGWDEEKIAFQEKKEVERQKFKKVNNLIKDLKENSGFWGKLKNTVGLGEKVDFNGEKMTLKELEEKKLELVRERKESFLKNSYLNSEKKDLDRFGKHIDKYSKYEHTIKTRENIKNTKESVFSKISPKTWSRLARGLSIGWAATGGAGLATWGVRYINGLVFGKIASKGVESFFNKKRKNIQASNELNLSMSKLEQGKGKDEFDFSEFMKMRTDNFEKLSKTQKQEFWTKLAVSGAVGMGAAYGSGFALNEIDFENKVADTVGFDINNSVKDFVNWDYNSRAVKDFFGFHTNTANIDHLRPADLNQIDANNIQAETSSVENIFGSKDDIVLSTENIDHLRPADLNQIDANNIPEEITTTGATETTVETSGNSNPDIMSQEEVDAWQQEYGLDNKHTGLTAEDQKIISDYQKLEVINKNIDSLGDMGKIKIVKNDWTDLDKIFEKKFPNLSKPERANLVENVLSHKGVFDGHNTLDMTKAEEAIKKYNWVAHAENQIPENQEQLIKNYSSLKDTVDNNTLPETIEEQQYLKLKYEELKNQHSNLVDDWGKNNPPIEHNQISHIQKSLNHNIQAETSSVENIFGSKDDIVLSTEDIDPTNYQSEQLIQNNPLEGKKIITVPEGATPKDILKYANPKTVVEIDRNFSVTRNADNNLTLLKNENIVGEVKKPGFLGKIFGQNEEDAFWKIYKQNGGLIENVSNKTPEEIAKSLLAKK